MDIQDLFGDKVRGEVTNGAKTRAKTVIEHWQEMAKNGIRRVEGELFGDILNPLANRIHDSLWEMGDGEIVSKLVEESIINNPEIAQTAYHHNVQRYVPYRLLDVANVVLMANQLGQHKDLIKSPDFTRKLDDLNELTTKHRTFGTTISPTSIQNAKYYGTVVDISRYFAIQNVGKNNLVVHDRLLLNSETYVGQKATFVYNNGRVLIEAVKAKTIDQPALQMATR